MNLTDDEYCHVPLSGLAGRRKATVKKRGARKVAVKGAAKQVGAGMAKKALFGAGAVGIGAGIALKVFGGRRKKKKAKKKMKRARAAQEAANLNYMFDNNPGLVAQAREEMAKGATIEQAYEKISQTTASILPVQQTTSPQHAVQQLTEQGYPPAQAQAMVDAAVAEQEGAAKKPGAALLLGIPILFALFGG